MSDTNFWTNDLKHRYEFHLYIHKCLITQGHRYNDTPVPTAATEVSESNRWFWEQQRIRAATGETRGKHPLRDRQNKSPLFKSTNKQTKTIFLSVVFRTLLSKLKKGLSALVRAAFIERLERGEAGLYFNQRAKPSVSGRPFLEATYCAFLTLTLSSLHYVFLIRPLSFTRIMSQYSLYSCPFHFPITWALRTIFSFYGVLRTILFTGPRKEFLACFPVAFQTITVLQQDLFLLLHLKLKEYSKAKFPGQVYKFRAACVQLLATFFQASVQAVMHDS